MTVTIVLLASAGSFLAYHAYWNSLADRAVMQAKLSFTNERVQESIISLKAALSHCPKHLEAHRAAASLLEASRSSEALVHRRKLMDLQPRFLQPKLAYARSALLFDKPQEAARVLDGIKGLNRRTPEFLELQAELFIARGRTDLALEIYRELAELHPEDRYTRAKLTALELQSGPEQVRDSARADLESLASDDQFGLIALRALTQDALRRQDFPTALSWSGRACEMPSADFSDRMLRLQALFGAKSPEYDSWLSDLKKRASENPKLALELAKWKVIAMGPQRAAAWLESAGKPAERAGHWSTAGGLLQFARSLGRSRVSHKLERLARARSLAPCLPGTRAGETRESDEIRSDVEAGDGGGREAARAAASFTGHGTS